MPNHVTTTMRVTGSKTALAAFRTQHFRIREEDEGLTLDFQTVLPMPDILRGIEASSRVEMAIERLTGQAGREFPVIAERFRDRSHWTDAQRKNYDQAMENLTPAELFMGEQAIHAIKETGHPTWYEWNIANWSTKWNAYEFSIIKDEPQEFVCRFDTAWSTPHKVFVELASLHPALTFRTDSYDEGGNFACYGEGKMGMYVEVDREVDATAYEAAYGHAREEDEEVDA